MSEFYLFILCSDDVKGLPTPNVSRRLDTWSGVVGDPDKILKETGEGD